MTGETKKAVAAPQPAAENERPPDWAKGLKRFYDSVVDEPLPDTFKDLLSKLDDGGK